MWNGTTAFLFVCCMMLLGGGGCLIGSESSVQRSGKYVSDNTLQSIKPGSTSSAFVQATLGEPSEKSTVDPRHEVWTYSYRETRDSSGYIFLIFGGHDSKTVDGHVYVEIRDGVVSKTWRG